MLDKTANFGRVQYEALNKPDWSYLNLSNIKVASIQKDKGDLAGFDLEAAIKKHPDHLFVKVFAIRANEINDNGDYFSTDELKKAVGTFINVPVFTNHKNDDIEKAKGRVVHAWYDEAKDGIYIISAVDKVAYPPLVRGIEEGYINGTSMGAQVQYSCCSICHNKAHTADEYCEHVRNQKNKKVSSRVKCKFHDSKCNPTEEKCPVCACKKGEEKYHENKQAQVFEHNYGIKFIEDSFVVNPACHDCLVDCVLNVPAVNSKLAEFTDVLRKAAATAERHRKATIEAFAADGESGLKKAAGKIEVEKLNEAAGLMEIVARSMLDQKQQVSPEYLSDIIDVMADLSDVKDELIEMGYAALPSPPTIQNYIDAFSQGTTPTVGASGATPTQGAEQPQPQPQQPSMSPPSGGGNASGLATITKPTTAGTKKEELVTASTNIKDKIEALRQKLAQAVAAMPQDAVASQASTTQANTEKESRGNMENQEKTAAGKGQSDYTQQVITQKQLDDAKDKGLLHPRTETSPEGITQSDSQLGRKDAPTDVTSDSPQTRYDNPPAEITEAQMAAVKGDEIVRWDKFPEVITEKQWEAIHREVGAVLSEPLWNHITQAQLRDLLSHHTWKEPAPNETTQRQLSEGGFGGDGQIGNLDRLEKSASQDTKKFVMAAINAIVDAIVGYSKTPDEIIKAASIINSTPQSAIKASYLLLLNALPPKREARVAERRRTAYFAKVASESPNYVKPVDALLACMGDHCSGLRAENFVEAVGFAAGSKPVMAKIETLVKEKLASRTTDDSAPVVDKFAAFNQAFDEIERPEDGLYQVQASFTEVGVSPKNKLAFVQAAVKLAKSHVSAVEVHPVAVEVNGNFGTVAVTLKEAGKMTADEIKLAESFKNVKLSSTTASKEARAKAREQAVKTAQFGGAMPGQGGAAPGGMGGAPAPAPAAGGGGAPPAPGVESMDQAPPAEDEMGGEGDAEPKPPGTVCPVCSSEDVDIVEGKGKCSNCNAEFTMKVQIDVTKWPNTLDGGDKGEDGTEGAEGEGFEMPGEDAGAPEGADASAAGSADGGAPALPVAAMTRLTPAIVQKVAAGKARIQKAAGNYEEMAKLALPVEDGGLGISIANQEEIARGNYVIGGISPVSGSTNTVKLANGLRLDLASGTPFVMEVAIDKKNPASPWVQWKWIPKTAGCSSCSRARKVFAKALKSVGSSEEEFETLDLVGRGQLILKAKQAGGFAQVKTASLKTSAVAEFKAAYAIPNEHFPMESCREKLARRFGQEAVALSGPCEGDNLADCVCRSLKKASVYADSLAVKVASVWGMEDGSVRCLESFVREGFGLKESATCCEALKMKYADAHEHFMEGMGDDMGSDPNGGGGLPADSAADDSDPFDGGDDVSVGGDLPEGGTGPVDAIDGADAGGDPMGGDPVTQTGPVMDGAPEVEITPGGEVHVNQEVLQALETLDGALQKAKGNDPAAGSAAPAGGADLTMPQAEGIDDAVQPALEDAGSEGGEETEVKVGDDPDAQPDATDGGEPDDNAPAAEESNDFGGDEANKENDVKKDEEFSFAQSMRHGVIGKTGRIQMDLSGVMAAIGKARTKTATDGKELKVQPAQDVKDIGKYQNGGVIGNESKFTADDPDVKSNESQSLIGNEKKIDAEKPKVPTGDQRMGHEESDLKPELADKITGGAGGAGGEGGEKVVATNVTTEARLSSTREMTRQLAARLIAGRQKLAGEVKVDDRKPTSETDGIGKIQDGKPMGNEKAFSAAEPEIPEKNRGAFMGKEEESIHDVPKPNSEFAPEVPSEKGEKVDEIKGTVIAKGDAKSQANYKEAFRVAGRMVAEQVIKPGELQTYVSELSQLSPNLVKAYENRVFAVSSKPARKVAKGLNTVQDGIEQPVVSYDAQSKGKSLTDRIASCFTLSKQVNAAEDENITVADLRRRHNR